MSVLRNDAPTLASVDLANSSNLLGMSSLVANNLYDVDGNFVGKLEEIIIDTRTGCVRNVVIAVGGILGMGRQRFAVPWSVLTPNAEYCRCVVDLAQMRLTAVPVPKSDPWLQHTQTPEIGPSGSVSGLRLRPVTQPRSRAAPLLAPASPSRNGT